MPRNQAISERLDNLTIDAATKGAQTSALNALIQADTPENFRQALLDHNTVFTHGNPDLYGAGHANNDEFIAPAGVDGQHSILELRQKAARKRIGFGLPEDLGGLQELLTQEGDQALLAWFKTKLSLFGRYDWEAEPKLLTEESLNSIRDQAKNRALTSINAQVEAIELAFTTANDQVTEAIAEPQAANIDTITEQLNAMNTSAGELDRYLLEQAHLIELLETNDELNQRAETIARHLGDTKATIRDTYITFINAQYGVFEEDEDVDVTVGSAELKLKMDTLKALFDDVTKAFILAQMSGVQVPEDEEEEDEEVENPLAAMAGRAEENADLEQSRLQKDNIERALIKLSIQYHSKVISEKAAAIAVRVTEISQAENADTERTLLGDAVALLRSITEAAAASAEQAAKATAEDGLYADEALEREKAEIIALNDAVQAAKKAAEESLAASQILVTLPQQPPHFGNVFFQLGGFAEREGFTTVVVRPRLGETPPDVAIRPEVDDLAARLGGGGGAAAGASAAKYRRKKLEPGDMVYSIVAFAPGATSVAANAKITVQLAQDSTGKVTYKATGGKPNPKQSIVAVMRMAEMLLMDFDPASGETIYITGGAQHAEQAHRLLAVMLRLKQNCPALKDIKIVSEVPGCVAPVATPARLGLFGGEDLATANAAFITRYLPAAHVSEQSMLDLEDQVSKFMQVKATRNEGFAALKQEIQAVRAGANAPDDEVQAAGVQRQALAQQAQDWGFKENEEFDLDGNRSAIAGP